MSENVKGEEKMQARFIIKVAGFATNVLAIILHILTV